jgi:hypothetical protein
MLMLTKAAGQQVSWDGHLGPARSVFCCCRSTYLLAVPSSSACFLVHSGCFRASGIFPSFLFLVFASCALIGLLLQDATAKIHSIAVMCPFLG